MSSSQQKSLIIIIIISLLGYVVAQFALSSVLTSSSLAIAIGILIGGVIATFSANGDTE